MSGDRRIEQLSRRVGWLDRYRRILAIGLAGVIVPLAISRIARWLPDEWPGAHLAALGTILAVVVWYTIEVALAALIALWETESVALARPALPRAELIDRKKVRRA